MSALVAAIVALLTSLLPEIEGLGASDVVDKIITTLINVIPQVVQFAQDLLPEVQNIITVLKSNQSVTPAQMQALAQAEVALDAAFEAAATAAGDPEPST